MFEVRIKRSAEKEIRALPRSVRVRVVSAIEGLAREPRPHGARKLAGAAAWRIRVGRYRIVYSIDDGVAVVEVVKVAHRKDVYR